MNRRLKAAISIVLTAIMLLGTVGIISFADDTEENTYSLGDTIEFGTYPKSEVKDESLLLALNSLNLNWESYGYYDEIDTRALAIDYMRYADVMYDGEKYRAVTFDAYRQKLCGLPTKSTDNTYQDDNGYYEDTIYWFKYEPLTWTVLDPEKGFVLCNEIIDSQDYQHIVYYGNDSHWYTSSTKQHYADDYQYSTIKPWLEDTFYNTAFNDSQKSDINGNIIILSSTDTKNSEYGFITNAYPEPKLVRYGTDYAKCQGLYVETESGASNWTLRNLSPNASLSNSLNYVNYLGSTLYYSDPDDTTYGICPAMYLNTLKTDTGYDEIHYFSNAGTYTPATCTESGFTTYKCAYCNDTKVEIDESAPALGHTNGQPVRENIIDSTCTEEGSCDEVIYCSACNKELERNTVTIPVSSHTPSEAVVENLVLPNCKTEGSYDSAIYCSNCSAEISRKTFSIPTVGHTLSEKVKENMVSATCTKDGSYDEVVYCSVCKEELSRNKITIPATGHNDADKNGYCDVCSTLTDANLANPCRNAVINVASAKTVDYKSNVIIKATATGVGNDCYLVIYVNGKQVAKGANTEVSYTVNQVTSDINYTVKVIDAKGNVQKSGSGNELTKDGGKITCNLSFSAKISAFFKGLFGLLPTVEVKP